MLAFANYIANLNIHLHALVLDGVNRNGNESSAGTPDTPGESTPAAVAASPIFHPAGASTRAALEALMGKIITRILRLLTRLGHLVEEDGQTYLTGGVTDPDDVMTPLQAAAANYRIAQGPRAGQKVLSLQLAPRRPARGADSSQGLCANAHGFSLHAGVRCRADDRQGLEQRCRYITRPATSQRAAQCEPRRADRAEAQDGVARWHQPPRDDTDGIHATPGRAGTTTAIAPDPLSWGIGTECEATKGGGAGIDREHPGTRR